MRRYHLDYLFVLAVVFICILGLTILRSVAFGSVLQQGLLMLAGVAVAVIFAAIDYRVWNTVAKPLYLVSLILLAITFVLGQATRGSVRWIPLGPIQLQTSELAKPFLAIFFAALVSKTPPQSLKQILLMTLWFLMPTLLIFRQPDLGSTLVVTSLWLGIMFMGGMPVKYLLLGLLALGSAIPFSWHLLKDYQKARLITFLNPQADPLKTGYHLMQSIIAVGSGMFLGRGLGHGTQSQLKFLPERHTDFIFAALSEELGFIGAALLILLFSFLLWRILATAQSAQDSFGKLLCYGIFSLLLFQVFINIGMNIGLTPITGITLPLVSFGGSSLITTFILLGLVLSVSLRQKSPDPFEIH